MSALKVSLAGMDYDWLTPMSAQPAEPQADDMTPEEVMEFADEFMDRFDVAFRILADS